MFAHSILASSDVTGSHVQLDDGHEYLGMDQGMSPSLLKRELYTFDLSVGSTRKAVPVRVLSKLALVVTYHPSQTDPRKHCTEMCLQYMRAQLNYKYFLDGKEPDFEQKGRNPALES